MSHGPASLSRLEIHLLGPFRIAVDGQPVEERQWARRKPKLLLKLLALQPHHQLHREQIIELLWPELDSEAAANNLHKTVHLARRALEPESDARAGSRFILTQDQQVMLRAPGELWIDLEAFEQRAAEALADGSVGAVEGALELYSGDLLPEDLYEDWAAARREHARQLYQELLARLTQLYEAAGEYQRAIERLRVMLASDPTNEEAHRQMMRLYAQTGSRHQALRQYRECCKALRRELDAEPEPATLELHEQIVSGKLQPSAPASIPTGAEQDIDADAAFAIAPPRTRLAGRQQELEQVKAHFGRALGGRGTTVLLGGEAGVGKTRLALEALERARQQGARLLVGACYEQEGQLPYGPFVEALARYARGQSQAVLADQLGAWAEPLARLVPIMAMKLGRAEAIRAARIPGDKQWLFAAVAGFFTRLAERGPVVLFLDDLHAADEDSLALMSHLARTAVSSRLLLMGSFREEECGTTSTLGRLLATLYREGLAARINLNPLSAEESQTLIAELLGEGEVSSGLTEYIFSVAAGNPFFTQEMVRALLEQGRLERDGSRWVGPREGAAVLPYELRDWVRVRLERCNELEQKVLSLASVVGQEAAWQTVLAVSALPEAALLNATDRLLEARILDATTSGFRFHHPLVREIVYQQLSPARRAQMHGRVAEAIERLYAARLDPQVETLAHHYSLSPNREKAAHFLALAGDRAAAVYANELAINHYRAALELSPDSSCAIALYEKLGDLQAHVGSNRAAADNYQAALEKAGAEGNGSPETPEVVERTARLRRKLAYQLILRTQLDAAEGHLRGAGIALAKANLKDSVEQARLHYTFALLHWHGERFDAALAAAQESLRVAESLHSRADTMLAYEALALTSLPLGDWKRGFEYECKRQSLSDLNCDIAAVSDVHL
ncbi:MAG: ATP-binding protein [Blastocatellia bacterium]